jgi:hypothetical protein
MLVTFLASRVGYGQAAFDLAGLGVSTQWVAVFLRALPMCTAQPDPVVDSIATLDAADALRGDGAFGFDLCLGLDRLGVNRTVMVTTQLLTLTEHHSVTSEVATGWLGLGLARHRFGFGLSWLRLGLCGNGADRLVRDVFQRSVTELHGFAEVQRTQVAGDGFLRTLGYLTLRLHISYSRNNSGNGNGCGFPFPPVSDHLAASGIGDRC